MIRTHKVRAGALALLIAVMGPTAAATINLYAAGSLLNVLTDVAKTGVALGGHGVERAFHLPFNALNGSSADADFAGDFENALISP